jgi:hypothetical protein
MGKYAPLGDFLRKQRASRIPMTFVEIERLIGTRLPKSQQYPAWWSNNPFNNVMTQVWLDAGFKTEEVDVESRKVVFCRVQGSHATPNNDASSEDEIKNSKAHPIIGWLRGTVRIAPDVDLTAPADPEWGERAWGNDA